MAQKKKLRELTFKDNFMFGAVMMEAENCKDFLELALGFPIERVEVSKEKSIVYHPEYKGIRLDVFAKDEHQTRYNVEMQVAKKEELGKRTRYYHSQIDMEMLLSGSAYENLPPAYVIFVCDFDPFGGRKYRYTFTQHCREDAEANLNDGIFSVFLSTAGKNEDEVPKELVTFLNFVKADLSESEADFEDVFVNRLQKSIRRVKSSREMEERFMLFEELLKEERAEGRVEGRAETILDLLEDLGEIPPDLRNRIESERDLETLKQWSKLSAKAASVEEFLEKM